MKLEYDIPEELTEKQYNKVMFICNGIVCGKIEDGKYYIKLWLTKYRNYVKSIIENN